MIMMLHLSLLVDKPLLKKNLTTTNGNPTKAKLCNEPKCQFSHYFFYKNIRVLFTNLCSDAICSIDCPQCPSALSVRQTE